ncbi:MAG: DnaJ-like, subfamily er 28, conserved domain protein [Proteobacteria bacterium]|nr:DnaJ-like, subfamily er 28, conserved domain protein [Pseudomonadota bacterium]
MLFLERLAEEKILQALERGEFDDLPGKGKPIPPEAGMEFVPEEMRTAFRILKNAGFVPEEVSLLRQIDDLARLLEGEQDDTDLHRQGKKRLHLLIGRLADLRGNNLALVEGYYQRIAAKLSGAE